MLESIYKWTGGKCPQKIGPVTFGDIPKEMSRYIFYLLQEDGLLTGSVTDIHPRISPIPECELEIHILM